jgi:uncharacterized protein YjaZ
MMGTMKLITVEKVPKKLLEVYKDLPLCEGNTPRGITLTPGSSSGFQKVEVLIQEKMSQYQTRLVIAHELIHVLQYLTGCELDEKNNDVLDEILVAALVDKKKVKRAKKVGTGTDERGDSKTSHRKT